MTHMSKGGTVKRMEEFAFQFCSLFSIMSLYNTLNTAVSETLVGLNHDWEQVLLLATKLLL